MLCRVALWNKDFSDHVSFGGLSVDRHIDRYVDWHSVSSQPRCRSRVGRVSAKYRPISRSSGVFLSVSYRSPDQPTVGRDSIGSVSATYRWIVDQVSVRYRWWSSAITSAKCRWYVDDRSAKYRLTIDW